jgi:hypothetical protein
MNTGLGWGTERTENVPIAHKMKKEHFSSQSHKIKLTKSSSQAIHLLSSKSFNHKIK